MSTAAKRRVKSRADVAVSAPEAVELPPSWQRLDQTVRAATEALTLWRRRARVAEAEVERLRGELGRIARAGKGKANGGGAELRRLRAENEILRSRVAEVRERLALLRIRVGALRGQR